MANINPALKAHTCEFEHNAASEGASVIETRQHDGRVYRRRRCPHCQATWITEERLRVEGWPRDLAGKTIARLRQLPKKPRVGVPISRARTADEILGTWAAPANKED